MQIYKRICSGCCKELQYSDYRHWWRSEKVKSVCRSCSKKGKPNGRLGKKHSPETIKKIQKGNIGKHNVSSETRKKLSLIRKGIKLPLEWRSKMWNRIPWNKGKTHSEETKYKLRIGTINHLKRNGIKFGCNGAANFNPLACKFIEHLNETFGLNLRHAQNGGEVEIYGYFVDGYDEKRNIIFEYDEPEHYKGDGTLKNRDLIRQNRLIEKVNPTIFLRYNEKEKIIYDVFKITR